jgi:hypothetical protein
VNGDDKVVWPCGSWCYVHELSEFGHHSDDYEVVPMGHPRYEGIE